MTIKIPRLSRHTDFNYVKNIIIPAFQAFFNIGLTRDFEHAFIGLVCIFVLCNEIIERNFYQYQVVRIYI